MVIEFLGHRWRWIDTVFRPFGSSDIAQEFLDVDLQDQKRKSSVVVQVSNSVLQTAIQDCEAKIRTVNDRGAQSVLLPDRRLPREWYRWYVSGFLYVCTQYSD